jgi:hypothetical protein
MWVGRVERGIWGQLACDRRALARRRESSLSGEKDDKIASHTAPGMDFTVWMALNSLKTNNWRREWDSNLGSPTKSTN